MSVGTLLVVAVGAVLAPLVAEIAPIAVPVVVLEVALGILGGPVLGIAEVDGVVSALAGLGLGFLFFLAGMEIDLARIDGEPLRRGAAGWVLSLAVAFAVAGGLTLAGVDLPVVFVAAALSTTAFGTLLPVLRDAGILPTALGRSVMGAGVCGELLPIILMSILLTGAADRSLTALLVLAFAIVAGLCALAAFRVRPPWLARLMERSMHSSSQLPVRACMLLLVALAYLAEDLGLDVILGAFAAGMVVRLATGGGSEVLESKLEAIGFGFLVPVFFIVSGLRFDLDGLTSDAAAAVLVPVFLCALLLVRGAPAVLYARVLGSRDRAALALLSSTTLPLIVAITAIAVDGGHMETDTAAALVGAGMLSVLVFPLLALSVRSKPRTAGVDLATEVPLGA
ncbi:MAG: cation:proton antiporter [Solirubrobacteraceae bacterium]